MKGVCNPTALGLPGCEWGFWPWGSGMGDSFRDRCEPIPGRSRDDILSSSVPERVTHPRARAESGLRAGIKKEKLSLGAEKRPPDLPGRSRGPGTSDAVSSAGVTERVTRRQSRCVFRGARLSGRPARPISLEGWGVGNLSGRLGGRKPPRQRPGMGSQRSLKGSPLLSPAHNNQSRDRGQKKCNSPKNIRP